MCCPARSDDALKSFELWMSQAEGKSACDFTFHMGVTKFDDKSERQLREIVKRGISSFKVFLAYKGAFGVDDTELYRTLKLAKELGVIVTAHCENETLVSERCKELLAAGKTGPGFHEPSRPVQVEAEGVHHLMTFAELTGAATYIVHLSCKEALDQAIAARQRGVRVGVETLIQYLTLDKPTPRSPKFEGAKYVMSPPAARQTKSGSALERPARRPRANRRHRPRAVRFPQSRRRWAKMISPRSPTAFRRSKNGSTCSTPTA
jgi:dihydropyrimidinase